MKQLLLALALLFSFPTQAQTAPSFAPVATYNMGGNPIGPQLVDINGDGFKDLLTANFNNSTLGVRLGTGTGTLGALATFPGGGQPLGLAVGDLNGDGRPDAVLASYSNGRVGVLLGNGTGGFGAVIEYAAGGVANAIAVGDVNGDGQVDVVVSINNGSVGVLLGTGTGSLGTAEVYLLGTGTSRGVALGDLNRDGRLDIVAAGSSAQPVAVLLNIGAGAFGPASIYAGGSGNALGVALGDVNGDGFLDVAVARNGSNTVGVLPGTGTGTLGTVASFTTDSTTPQDITIGDLNNDGKPDLVAGEGNSTGSLLNAKVFLNTTVFIAPTLISLNPTSGPVGTSVMLTGQNLTGATAVNFNGTAATFTVVNATTITATVPAGATTGNVTVTTPGGTSNGVVFTVTYPDLVINTTTTIPPGIYNSITVNSPGNATLGGAVTVNTSTTINSGAALNDGCFVLSGAGSFTLAAGGTLGICNAAGISASGATGAIQNTGTRSFASDASYVYNGTVSQVTGSGLPSQVRNLTVSNSAGVTLTNNLTVAQVVRLNSGNLSLSGKSLLLPSTTAGTALVNNAGGQVLGATASVQRLLTNTAVSGPAYRHLSSPVATMRFDSLSTGGFSPVFNTAYNSSTTPGLVSPFPTVFGYDQGRITTVGSNYNAFDRGWFSPAGSSSLMAVGRGYTINAPIGATPYRFTGTLNTGAQSSGTLSWGTSPDGGWQLLGNPYPSPLDWSSVTPSQRPGVDGAMYVYQSSGQYAGTYRTYQNGLGASPIIESSAAYFVRLQLPVSNGVVNLTNANRVTTYGNPQLVGRSQADQRPQLQLQLRTATLADDLYLYLQNGATAGVDAEFDARKLPNPSGLNLSTVVGSELLAIDGRSLLTASTIIPLAVGVPAAGTYSLAAAELANLPAGLTPTLRDAATGQLTPLAAGTSYRFSVTATEATALLTGRFTLQFNAATPLATAASLAASEVTVYPNPALGRFTVLVPAVAGASQVQVELLNTLGQVVRRQVAALPAAGATLVVEAAGLATGVYTLRLTAGTSTLAKRVVLQ